MNLMATLQAMIPNGVPPRSEVAAIIARVLKAPKLVEAERAFAGIAAARLPLSKRRAEIFERLHVKSPMRTLFKPEQDQLEAEQAHIDRQAADLNARATELR